jgi:hypothetical protein
MFKNLPQLKKTAKYVFKDGDGSVYYPHLPEFKYTYTVFEVILVFGPNSGLHHMFYILGLVLRRI